MLVESEHDLPMVVVTDNQGNRVEMARVKYDSREFVNRLTFIKPTMSLIRR